MKHTAVNWLIDQLEEWGAGRVKWPTYLWEKAEEMEREQHGETWDSALIHVDKRGGVILRALIDFDDYWAEKGNAPNDEGIDQPGLPEGEN